MGSCRQSASDAIKDATAPFLKTLAKDWKKPCAAKLPDQKKILQELDTLATACRDLIKTADLMFKLSMRVVDVAEKDANAKEHDTWDNRTIGRLEKELDMQHSGG